MPKDYRANPDSLKSILAQLRPGDILLLDEGHYQGGVDINVSGTKEEPLTVRGSGPNVLFSGGGNCINVYGSYVAVEGVNCTRAERAGIWVHESTGSAVRRCRCFDNGTWGIISGFAEAIVVEGNECYGSRKEHGIYLANSTDNAVCRRNHCHHNRGCGIQFNGDPFIPGGDGVMSHNLIEANVLHDNWTNFNCTCVADSIIRNNLFYGCNTKAIACWDTEAGYQYSSKRNVIINNTFVMDGATRECIQLRNGATNNVIRNNIFAAPFFAVVADPSSVEGTQIDHNIYFASVEPERFIWAGALLKVAEMQKSGLCSGDITTDPLFENWQALDFSLAMESPAIDAGAPDDRAGDQDLFGNPRVSGRGIDIGACEYQW